MSTPSPATVTLLQPWQPHLEARPRPTGCYVCSVRLFCHHMARNAFTAIECNAVLSPGDPYSVLFPLNTRESIRVPYDPISHGGSLSWYGVPCELIEVRIGLAVVASPTPRPFRLLALLPTEPVEDTPPLLRLGAEFLTATRASVRLFTHPTRGELIIPQP